MLIFGLFGKPVLCSPYSETLTHAHVCCPLFSTGKEAHDLDKEMLIEKLIKNYPFDYTALLEAAENQSESII